MPQCLSASMPQCLNVSMPQCLSASIPRYLDASMPRCLDTSMPRCLDTSMPRCLDASIPRCLDTSMSRYLDGISERLTQSNEQMLSGVDQKMKKTEEQPGKLPLRSMSLTEDRKRRLKQLFPEVFNEKKIDWEKLKTTLGGELDTDRERYNMTWPGKRECFHIIQEPSFGTLKPRKGESLDWDTTQNLFIEGDNLEVLKLLQHSYYGKIKMIYIDPPYNTGKDFIYPDRYSENVDTYLEYTGQKDALGKKFSTNQETDGRFHSKWINMMYPRLFLARNLLRDDGVIFISIDDNEVTNLRKICDEIFGEENFLIQCAWRKTDNQANIGLIARVKEYIIVYGKDIKQASLYKMALTERAKKEYRYSDNKGRFRRDILLHKTRGRYIYDLKMPSGKILSGPWMKKQSDFQKMLGEGQIYYTKGGQEQPYGKIYLHESDGQIPNDFLTKEYGTNQQGSLEVESLFNARYFDFPKPSSLIKHFVTISTKNDNIILDFFAGSATTAHAVYEKNMEDGGNRKYICIQLPEPTQKNTEAYKAGYKNIAEIGKERIGRAVKKIKEENRHQSFLEQDKNPDLGFRVFKLDQSNFRIWDGDISKEKLKQIEMHLEGFVDNRSSEEDLLYEILIKTGFQLTTEVEILKIENKTVYSVENKALLICLEKELTKELILEMARLRPARVVCLDSGFEKNDWLKTNAVDTMRSHEVRDFKTI